MNDDDQKRKMSPDDALEEELQRDLTASPQEPEENGDTPTDPPDDVEDNLPADHPLFDDEADAHEIYDEGLSNAVSVNGVNTTGRT